MVLPTMPMAGFHHFRVIQPDIRKVACIVAHQTETAAGFGFVGATFADGQRQIKRVGQIRQNQPAPADCFRPARRFANKSAF